MVRPRAFAPYAEPLTFVAVRNAGAAVVLVLAALALRRPWPRTRGDQIVPIGASAMMSSKIIKNATLKVFKGAPHGMCTTLKDEVNAELLAFFRQASGRTEGKAA